MVAFRHAAAKLAQRGRLDGRIEPARFQLGEQIGGAGWKHSGANGLRRTLPVIRGSIPPAGTFRDQAVLNLGHAGVEARKIALGRHGTTIEEMTVDAVSKQHLEIGVTFGGKCPENTARPSGAGGVSSRHAQKAIGISRPELEASSRNERSGATKLGFAIAVKP